MNEQKKFRWRARSIKENVWTSAVLSLFSAVAITAFSEVAIGPDFSRLIAFEYTWITVCALFLVFFIARMPKKRTTDRT